MSEARPRQAALVQRTTERDAARDEIADAHSLASNSLHGRDAADWRPTLDEQLTHLLWAARVSRFWTQVAQAVLTATQAEGDELGYWREERAELRRQRDESLRAVEKARAWARQLARMRANPMTGDRQLLREFAALEWAREG
jgi:hypothetical protein